MLVRNLATLEFFRSRTGGQRPEMVGDFSLNAANELAAGWLTTLGLARITPAPDLDRPRLEALAAAVGPERIEAPVLRHAPMFHTKHCLHAAHLARGGSCTDCGEPCAGGRLTLRDRKGVVHPVLVDPGGRSTVYSGSEQSALEAVPGWLALGIRHFRVELLDEDAKQTGQLLARAAGALGTANKGS